MLFKAGEANVFLRNLLLKRPYPCWVPPSSQLWAFLPAFLSKDTAGTYVHDLFLVLAISLFISWLLALTQVPLFSAMFLRKKKKQKDADGDGFDKPVYRLLRKTLQLGMHHRLLTISLFFVLLIGASFAFKWVNKTFFPDFNYNQLYIELAFPKETSPRRMPTITES